MQQLTLNYDASEFEGYQSLREFMQTRVIQLCVERKKLHKMIAADMDMAPSCLTRKLAGAESDKRRLTVDDLELYVETQQDTKPVLYLVDKFLTHGSGDEIAELERLLAAAKKRARK